MTYGHDGWRRLADFVVAVPLSGLTPGLAPLVGRSSSLAPGLPPTTVTNRYY